MNKKKYQQLLAIAILGSLLSINYVAKAEEKIWNASGAEQNENAPLEITLENAIDMTLSRNPQLDGVDADRQAARRRVEQAKASYGPTVGATHSETRTYSDANTFRKDVYSNQFSNGVNLNWVLYSGGATQGQVKQAKEGYNSGSYGVVLMEQSLRMQTAQAYYQVLYAAKTVENTDEAVARMEEHLKNTKLRFEVGLVAKADVLRSEVEVANAKQNLIKAKNSLDLAYANLANLIWVDMGTTLVLKDSLGFTPDERTLEESISYAKLYRPEIHQSFSSIDSAKAAVRSARAGYYPTVAVSAGYNKGDVDRPGWETTGWNVGGTVKLTLFDSFYTRGRVGEAMAKQEKAESTLQTTIQGIDLEVRQAWLNLQEAKERIQASSVAISQAEEDYKIAQARYQAGVGTNLDVLDSQNALTNAQTNYASSLFDYNNNRAKLDKAMGMGVKRPISAEELERTPLPSDMLNKKIEELKENPEKTKILFPGE
jgi:outer membrane protein